MFQKVTIIGNLGGDPETRYMEQSGANVCSFSVATNRKWTNNDGTQGEETVWWRVSAWGRLGEVCQQYLNKGRLVYIEGTVTADRETGNPRIWTDQNGNPRASFELRANEMKMLGGRDDGSHSAQESQDSYQAAPQQQRSSAPQRGSAPQRQAAPAPAAGGNRRSTASAPAAPTSYDDDFGADEIPF